MKIGITGAKGMLAHALIPLLKNQQLILLDLPKVDITNKEILDEKLKDVEFVFHIAAYTSVDEAERNSAKAFEVNAKGTINIAEICNKYNIPVLYISTDYVFSGKSDHGPWFETDKPQPQGVYAKSKLAGEEAIKKICEKYFIVRTAWLYGSNGKNFVETMLTLADQQKQLKVVDDQIGSPTYTCHLAEALVKFLDIKKYGIYHITNQGETSWYGFACKIFELNNKDVKVLPCQTSEFPRLAPRPEYSMLRNKNWQELGFSLLPSWEFGLKEYLKEKKS